ncbi:DUF3325 domain-containing protein [Pseudoxanthomonas beigongshangi]|uniref:DUF3325 domain-containing protein n=1 Tax=Pseudoxanthomonas beigongshangi TaxID=2782537 RepID=UPI00193B79F3|nr:DUF3325 domain-containing protein [Pseudoxanthomonas beigongshangi]UBB27089.1 DUF3325 domain-containing protein [Pseudoxanthomonas japonensis]
MSVLVFLLLTALAYAGFAALCLSMEKHQMDLHGAARAGTGRMRQWRWLGGSLLALALLVAGQAEDWARGPVIWLGAMTAAGLSLALGVLPYRPRWLVGLAWMLAGLVALAALHRWLA